MKKTLLLFVLLCTLILSACAPASYSGTVTDKAYQLPYTTYMPICQKIGNILICNQIPIYHSEEWVLRVETDNGTFQPYVTKAVYDACKIGATYSTETGCS